MNVRCITSFFCLAGLIFIIGCAPGVQEQLQICPGSKSVGQSIDTIRQHSEKISSFWAKGKCRLTYYDKGKKHPETENMDVTVLVKSGLEIYLQADIGLISKAVIAGSNKDEFWLAIRPDEISSYLSGQWSQLNSTHNILLNPRTVLEAMGVTEVQTQSDWSLSNQGVYDILTKKENGVIAKKIYIYCCDYSIRKIEYFDNNGFLSIVAELKEYKTVSNEFSIPGKIEITTSLEKQKEDTISLALEFGSVETRQITAKQDDLFRPSPAKGFKNIYKLIDGQWIEQSQ
jgi:hypothetical protein